MFLGFSLSHQPELTSSLPSVTWWSWRPITFNPLSNRRQGPQFWGGWCRLVGQIDTVPVTGGMDLHAEHPAFDAQQ